MTSSARMRIVGGKLRPRDCMVLMLITSSKCMGCLSYDLTLWSRVYAGAGFLMHREPSDIDRWTTQFGVELQSPKAYWSGHVRPVLGADFQSRAEHDWHTDVSIQAGVQLEARKTAEHKI